MSVLLQCALIRAPLAPPSAACHSYKEPTLCNDRAYINYFFIWCDQHLTSQLRKEGFSLTSVSWTHPHGERDMTTREKENSFNHVVSAVKQTGSGTGLGKPRSASINLLLLAGFYLPGVPQAFQAAPPTGNQVFRQRSL